MFLSKIKPARFISLLLFWLCSMLTLAYGLWLDNRLAMFIFLSLALTYGSLYLLASKEKSAVAAVLLSVITPLLILVVTLLYKANSQPDPVNYFDSRIMLIASAIIPLTTISLSTLRRLSLSLLPSFLGILLYDPIHQAFGLGYFQQGLSSPDYFISANMYAVFSYLVLVAGLLRYQHLQDKAEQVLKAKNEKLSAYLDTILSISELPALSKGEVMNTYKEIALAACDCLQVSRVSIWHYAEEEDYLLCVQLYEQGEHRRQNNILRASDYPAYFQAIKSKGLIIAADAYTHPATAEFKQSYLKPNNICSMMDAMFHIDGKLAGIICCEEIGKSKQWNTEESIFLNALADFVCLVHNIQCRREREKELAALNEHLENRVKERTAELHTRNKQLAEYAYINSHMLRAPLARVSGLTHLLQTIPIEQLRSDYLPHLKDSIDELEQITQRINAAIDTYGTITREQLAQEILQGHKKREP